MWLHLRHCKTVCTESWLGEKNNLLHQRMEPTTVACRSNTYQLSYIPFPVTYNNLVMYPQALCWNFLQATPIIVHEELHDQYTGAADIKFSCCDSPLKWSFLGRTRINMFHFPTKVFDLHWQNCIQNLHIIMSMCPLCAVYLDTLYPYRDTKWISLFFEQNENLQVCQSLGDMFKV